VKARAIDEILTTPVANRTRTIATGLASIAEHVETLRKSTEEMLTRLDVRAARLVDTVAEEEAAKALILLDLVRLGWRDQVAVRDQLKRFYNHLARGIYAELVHAAPATFREVHDIVNDLRRSHYLDGPSDIDWTFRNEIESSREEAIYVDYIQTDEGPRWISPASHDDITMWGPSAAAELVGALRRSGLLSEPGLDLIAAEWTGVLMEPDTHWATIEGHTRNLVYAAVDQSLVDSAFTPADTRRIIHSWGFPLHSLDMTLVKVTKAELDAHRGAGMESLAREWYGF
jgi:AbiV family abortive infection protein